MHIHRKIALVALLGIAPIVSAQRPGTIEAGIFGHVTTLDKDVLLGSSSIGAGGRIGFFPLRYVALEAEYSFGTIKSNVRDVSVWLPFRGLVVANIPVAPRVKVLLGAGYKQDTWKGDTTANQYEDGFSALAGFRVCLKNNWSVRPEVVFDFNPSPNFQPTVTSTSKHVGFRFGVSRFFGRGKETCAASSPSAPPPVAPVRRGPTPVTPPVVVPPPAPPAPRPTVTISASPESIVSGSASTLRWSSSNAVSCDAQWTGNNGASGNQIVRPTSTTTYSTTCSGAGGTATASTTVSVTEPTPPPTPVTQTPRPAPQPAREMFRLEGVFFDFDKSTIKPEGKVKLDSAVKILNRYSDMQVQIQGHTDSVGTDDYNQKLSERRANAVRDYIVSKGIATSRLTTKGFGESQPATSNSTRAGRAENRRVMLIEMK